MENQAEEVFLARDVLAHKVRVVQELSLFADAGCSDSRVFMDAGNETCCKAVKAQGFS